MTTPPAERLPDLAVLFPFRAWLRHTALRAWTTWLFVALVAVPPATLVIFANADGYGGPAVMFAAYFAAAWFLVLWVIVRPQNKNRGLVAGAADCLWRHHKHVVSLIECQDRLRIEPWNELIV